jgi:hypothetical protein
MEEKDIIIAVLKAQIIIEKAKMETHHQFTMSNESKKEAMICGSMIQNLTLTVVQLKEE